jgi:hypothetical protein
MAGGEQGKGRQTKIAKMKTSIASGGLQMFLPVLGMGSLRSAQHQLPR